MAREPGSLASRPLPEALVRGLRHEVGDLLQSVYAVVALLQRRLPADTPEQRLLADLRARAERCRNQLDAAHDFICPLRVTPEDVDLAGLAKEVAAEVVRRYPHLHIHTEADRPALVSGDRNRLAHLGHLLLQNACEAARDEVQWQTVAGPGTVEWHLSDNGPGVEPESLRYIFDPFFTTRPGRLGLGLPLARKLAELHGGQITAENRPGSGFVVRVVLPRARAGT